MSNELDEMARSARRVRSAVDELNAATAEANKLGLIVSIDCRQMSTVGKGSSYLWLLVEHIGRPL